MPDHFTRWDLVDRFDIYPLFRPVRVRILVVADSAVSFNTPFGIGMAIDTLRDPAFPYVRFEVTLARREGPASDNPGATGHTPRYTGFRFDRTEPDGTPTLHQYHQVWCFGFEPGNTGSPNDDDILDPSANPLSDAELAVLARWMNERRGGVFATGDHHFLGASIASRIPRVGTMRRWTNAQGVPPIGGPSRIDTNRPATPGQGNIGGGNPDEIPNTVQEDAVPQPIEWKRYYRRAGIFSLTSSPHPLLCDRVNGVVDVMPDHPHEGQVVADADVVLTGSYDFDGYTGDEYPAGPSGSRPRPEVIAWGTTLPDPPYNFEKGDSPAKRFPMIGVYDGDRAGVGRVVVDSTWHHWMDMNLAGLEAGAPVAWAKIQTYFRNIGVWLATPAQRSTMLFVATWATFYDRYTIEEYGEHLSIWELGRSARDVLGRYASACQVREWTAWFLPEKLRLIEDLRRFKPDPCLSCPPPELFEMAVLGGIVQVLLPYARRSMRQHFAGDGKWLPDPDEVMPLLAKGAYVGLQAAVEVAREGAQRATEIAELLEAHEPRTTDYERPFDTEQEAGYEKRGG